MPTAVAVIEYDLPALGRRRRVGLRVHYSAVRQGRAPRAVTRFEPLEASLVDGAGQVLETGCPAPLLEGELWTEYRTNWFLRLAVDAWVRRDAIRASGVGRQSRRSRHLSSTDRRRVRRAALNRTRASAGPSVQAPNRPQLG
jgi:hypothetical protein